MQTIITNAIIFLPNEVIPNGWLAIENGKIADVGQEAMPDGKIIDGKGAYLLPGFIDVHVHGAIGHDVMDANAQGLQAMSQFFAQHGVTSWLPTTLTAPHDAICTTLKTVKLASTEKTDGAQIIGAHLEGPYLNSAKCGAQDARHIRSADPAEIDDILNAEIVCLASIAPEYEENLVAIQQMKQRGVTVSAAHTNASLEQMQAGIECGISHSTHTFNAMPALHHRNPSGLSALLLEDSVFCEVIADGVHVHPQMIELLYRLKGRDKVILITDAMRATGLGAGTYQLGDLAVNVDHQRATLSDGTLAGSILTMDAALRHMLQWGIDSLDNLWRTTSYNAANSLGIAQKGSITVGYDADLVLLSHDYYVQQTIINGETIYAS